MSNHSNPSERSRALTFSIDTTANFTNTNVTSIDTLNQFRSEYRLPSNEFCSLIEDQLKTADEACVAEDFDIAIDDCTRTLALLVRGAQIGNLMELMPSENDGELPFHFCILSSNPFYQFWICSF